MLVHRLPPADETGFICLGEKKKLLHPTLTKLSALVADLAVLAGFARLAGLTWRLAELASLAGRGAPTGRAGIR